jgi:hypothetical protein
MAEIKRRLVDRITDPSYLEGLESRSVAELKAMDEECREGELEVSFERRLCQARIDILTAELERRERGEESSLLERLPQILASDGPRNANEQPLPSRAPDLNRIPRNADVPRRRVEEIVGEMTLARLPQLPAGEIETIVASLRAHETSISARRKQVHKVIDRIQGLLVPRLRVQYGIEPEPEDEDPGTGAT